jgi:hypothetical protein
MHNTTREIAHVVDEFSLGNEFKFMQVLRNTWDSTYLFIYLFICKPRLNKTLVPYRVYFKAKVGSKTAISKESLKFVYANTCLSLPTIFFQKCN